MRARRFMRRKQLALLSATVFLLTSLSFTFWRSSELTEDTYAYERSLARGDSFAHPFYEKKPSFNVSARFEERRRRAREVCRHDNISVRLKTRAAATRFVFPTTTLPTVLYCPMPRIGTQFMRKVMAAANNVVNPITWRERFHVRDVSDGYDKALMFVFTREPYSRLLSAYINTLWVPNQEFWSALGGPIIGALRSEPTLSELACGHDVTFPELVRYVILSMDIGHDLNGYFMPTYSLCEVCNYDYDYIGHMETFSEDAAHILSRINLTIPPEYKGLEDDEYAIVNNYAFNAYFTLKSDNEKCLSKYLLLLRVWRALQIRGLISTQLGFPLLWEDTLKLKRYEFRTLLEEALNKSKVIFKVQDQKLDQESAESQSRDDFHSQSGRVFRSSLMQRRVALASAWNLVPVEDKRKIRDLFDKEFKLFGYDPFLEDVFFPTVKIDKNILDLSRG